MNGVKMRIFLIYLVIINLISFILYGIDKRKAIKNKSRIREKTLFLFSFIGGCVGALFGMLFFRHKTKKIGFYVVNIFSLIIWIGIVIKVGGYLWK